jgi:hypothetical protein
MPFSSSVSDSGTNNVRKAFSGFAFSSSSHSSQIIPYGALRFVLIAKSNTPKNPVSFWID